MKNKNELNYKELKMTCNPNVFNFETTGDLDTIEEGIGQERGIKALEFGLQVDVKGYNLYIEGPSGVGKTLYTKNYLNKIDKSIINRELKKNKNVLYELLPNAYVLGLSDKIISVSNDIELEGPSWYKVKKFKVDEFYQDFKNIYSDIFIALKSSKK